MLRFRHTYPLSRMALRVACAAMLSVVSVVASATLSELGDDEMGSVSGEGLTFGWSNFRIMFDPNAYIESIGSPNGNTCTSTGATNGNYQCFRRAELRWYGASGSSNDGNAVVNNSDYTPNAYGNPAGIYATTWTSSAGVATQCADSGIAGMGCPRGGPVQYFAAYDNPYILRVLSYAGDNSAASAIGNGIATYEGNAGSANWNSLVGSNVVTAGSAQTVLDWLAPAKISSSNLGQDRYRVAFWGELEVGRGGTHYSGTCPGAYVYGSQNAICANSGNILKSQLILTGNAAGSALHFWKFTQRTTSPGMAAPYNPLLGAAGCTDSGCANVDGTGSPYDNRTIAFQYESHLQSDFRFSVSQTEATPSPGVPVVFDPKEGVYFRNADVFVPIGQQFYQAWTINLPRNTSTNAITTDGNYTLEIPLLPNRTAVFTRFYSLNTGPSTVGNAPSYSAWDWGYVTARAAYLAMLAPQTATYMPDANAPGTGAAVNYATVNANYNKTHGYAHWGDWFPCQGVGCIYPTTANSAAQALAGTGRNAWNSAGDGTFFIGKTQYNAISYTTWATDVQTPQDSGGANNGNNNQYTNIATMANLSACSQATLIAGSGTSGSPYTTCGYGGPYNASTAVVANQTIVLPYNAWYNSAAVGLGTTGSVPVVAVAAGTPLNIGDSRIEGLQINYLRFTSYGANY